MFNSIASDNIFSKMKITYSYFFIVFNLVIIGSYYILPKGVIGESSLTRGIEESSSLLFITFGLFLYNLIPITMILIGNMVIIKDNENAPLFTLGYIVFFILITLKAVTLGTWSFSESGYVEPLLDRILRVVDILTRSGAWIISGQIFIVCATTKISLISISRSKITTRKLREVRLSKQEIVVILLGLILTLMGSYVDGYDAITGRGM